MMTSIKFLQYLWGNFKPYVEIPLKLMGITCSPIKEMLMPHVSVLEDRMYQNDRVRKGTKGQRGHVRCNDMCFSLLDI